MVQHAPPVQNRCEEHLRHPWRSLEMRLQGCALPNRDHPFCEPEAIERAKGVRILARLAANYSSFGPSATNYVTLDCSGDGAFALRVLEALAGLGVFIRKPMARGLDRCIRITAGTDDLLDLLENALPIAMAAARS